MGRIAGAVVLAAVAAAVIAAPATAKWGIELGSTPAGLGPNDPWNVEIRVVGSHLPALSRPPFVRIWNEKTRLWNAEARLLRTYRARPLPGRPRIFEATIRFPKEGLWHYVVRHGGARFTFAPVVIQTAPAPSTNGAKPIPGAAGSEDGGGFPLWPVLGGSLAAVLLAGAGLSRIRARRLPPWPAVPSSARTASRGR